MLKSLEGQCENQCFAPKYRRAIQTTVYASTARASPVSNAMNEICRKCSAKGIHTNQRSDDVFETERGGGCRYVGMIGAFRRGSHRAVLLFGHRWACRPYRQTDFHRRRS